MKRAILLILLAALCLSALSGCGAGAPPAPTPEPTAAPTPSPEPTPTPAPAEHFPFPFEQQLLDAPHCAASVTALGRDDQDNWIVHLLLENRSGEIQRFRFRCQSFNGLAAEDFDYRLASGESAERSFRVFHDVIAATDTGEALRWDATLQVSSVESLREDFALQRISVRPYGDEAGLFAYEPPEDAVCVLDNYLAAVYITGWTEEEGGIALDYAAVNRSGQPLRLWIPDWESCTVNGKECSAVLDDGLGPEATILGYIPFDTQEKPDTVRFLLLLSDPFAAEDSGAEDEAVWVELSW